MSDPLRRAGTEVDLSSIREKFPILAQKMRGKRLAYLDNAASTQKPRAVIDALSSFYATSYANVHRGIYELSERATEAYEGARERVRRFLNAREMREIVFVRGTTEAINLVASSFGEAQVGEGDEILISAMEHHSNTVPWQILCERRRAKLCVVPIDDRGDLMLDEFERRIGPRTRLVALVHVSNALGTLNPVRAVVERAHRHGVPVLLDGAQAVARMPVDVQELDCDFYAFSGHKLYGPSGIGVLYGRAELLAGLPPYQAGGEMIASVSFEKTTFAEIPARFEAGTPNIADAVGLAAALDFVEAIGLDRIGMHEAALLDEAVSALARVPGLRFVGTPRRRVGAVSFVLDGVHPHDAGTILDQEGIAVRAGHHCAQPVMERFGVPATIRASFGVYNTPADIEALLGGLEEVRKVFA